MVVFAGAVVAPVLHRVSKKYSPWLLMVLPGFSFAGLLSKLPEVLAGSPVRESYTWVEGLGVHLQFNLDGLSLLFALLITGIGALIVLYGGSYLAKDKNLSSFYAFLFLFMGAMLGMVLSDNIFVLFVFWELTSLSSYLLIGYKHGDEGSRKSALQALLVTGVGGLALMAGLILAAAATGSPRMSDWLVDGSALVEYKHFGLMLTLLLIGAFTKSAQFPFHFWLPNAMVAPTPVSAYLHSATMVKAGVYLLARLNPYFSVADEWQLALCFFGGITMLLGAIWALFQVDIKKMLAYTTISALGVLVFSIGIGTPKAIQGAMLFLLAHAMYKGGLFMIAGNIDKATGTRDVSQLSGLFSRLRFTGTAAVLTTLSMAGFPLLLGFLAKEMLYESAMYAPQMAWLFTIALFLTSVIFAALAYLLGWKVFFSKKPSPAAGITEMPAGMWLGPVLLGAGGLLMGLLPGLSVEGLLAKAADSVSSAASGLKLELWHGFTAVLALSIGTLLSGWGLYKVAGRFHTMGKRLYHAERFGPEAIYESGWKVLTRFAEKLTAFVQSGYLRFYIMTIVVTLIVLAVLPICYYQLFDFNLSFAGIEAYEVLLAILVAAAILFTVTSISRLAAIAIMGVVGYGIALFYAIYGGADLAMTQFLIETLALVVFVYVLYKLPGYVKLSSGFQRYRDLSIALAGGATMTAIILLVTNYPLVSELKSYFANNSYVLAKGRNVVNVILVDFRALDTLGEITVLAIAALGVYALMKLKLGETKEEK